MKEDFDKFLPLSPAALHILLALVSEDRHGYGIMQEVARQSDDRYKLGPGTLYDNLEKLLNQGVVGEATRRSLADDPRRSYEAHVSLSALVASCGVSAAVRGRNAVDLR